MTNLKDEITIVLYYRGINLKETHDIAKIRFLCVFEMPTVLPDTYENDSLLSHHGIFFLHFSFLSLGAFYGMLSWTLLRP